MEIFRSIDELARALSVPGIAVILLFGLYKEWWYIKPTVTRMTSDNKTTIETLEKQCSTKDDALDAALRELNETKIVYATLQARYEAREQLLKERSRRGTAS